jgi:hypothetical protein
MHFILLTFPINKFTLQNDIAINLASNNTNETLKKEKQIIVSCEHCPMVWFHKLCSDIESMFKILI